MREYSLPCSSGKWGPVSGFAPSRGLRQGDPISPYLFIICAEVLSNMVRMEAERGAIKGIRVCRNAPEVTHLFFADDSIFFCRAEERNVEAITRVLNRYSAASGQETNFSKSEVSLSTNVPNDGKMVLAEKLGVRLVNGHGSYLGMPTVIGKSKTRAFSYLKERVWKRLKRLKGWKQQLLSFAGREILLKAVVQAIPTYIMSLFRLPLSLCNDIQSMMARFWWGGKDNAKKISWVSWNNLSKKKVDGGMGYRRIIDFNEALLAKQAWRIMNMPELLSSRILRARYFPNGSFLNSGVGCRPSYIWRSIGAANGSWRKVANGWLATVKGCEFGVTRG
ncbi:uncharacterized protein [Spinacia oleracea]|uniref:Reverse transcriptase domain-containing protein n=1 Tax=Spinacia oleracea TaxID=3562 RepID=A0A9R0HY31_SPIOL|nr:uncharacterized protein LOC110778871 [Spinacia oleracea]